MKEIKLRLARWLHAIAFKLDPVSFPEGSSDARVAHLRVLRAQDAARRWQAKYIALRRGEMPRARRFVL